jgi:hypothetical protein
VSQDELLARLQALELLLHQHEVRRDRERLGALLHPQFTEFGRSGRVWTRHTVLDEFTGEQTAHPDIHAEEFAVQSLGDGVALLTYRSAHIQTDGSMSRWTLRSSLWQRVGDAWLMRFHQGTACEPVVKTDIDV